MARFAAVLGVWALFLGLSSVSAKMYFLPDYQNGMYAKRVNVSSNPSSSTPTLRSCDDYPGFISEVEKGDLDCSIIKYVP